MNLEDETGLVNVVCSPGCWVRYRRLARDAPALVVTGRLELSLIHILGYSVGQQDAWAKELGRWGPLPKPGEGRPEGISAPDAVIDLAGQLQGAPRHLGIHSGGMVMCDRPVVEVCPTEWGRMENRSVLQWDKDCLLYTSRCV